MSAALEAAVARLEKIADRFDHHLQVQVFMLPLPATYCKQYNPSLLKVASFIYRAQFQLLSMEPQPLLPQKQQPRHLQEEVPLLKPIKSY